MWNFSRKFLLRMVTAEANCGWAGLRGQCLIAVKRKMAGYGKEAWEQIRRKGR